MAGNLIFDKWLNDDTSENFKCRAWVNFNGTGTVAIRGSGNVSSITDNGVGDYTVNFTNAMPDVNYAINVTSGLGTGSVSLSYSPTSAPTINNFNIVTVDGANTLTDTNYINVSIHR